MVSFMPGFTRLMRMCSSTHPWHRAGRSTSRQCLSGRPNPTQGDDPARIRPQNSASLNSVLKAGLLRDPMLDDGGEDGLDLIFRSRLKANRRAGL